MQFDLSSTDYLKNESPKQKITIYPKPNQYKGSTDDWISWNFIFLTNTYQSVAEYIHNKAKNNAEIVFPVGAYVITYGGVGNENKEMIKQFWKIQPNALLICFHENKR